jgi:hypothetical protein
LLNDSPAQVLTLYNERQKKWYSYAILLGPLYARWLDSVLLSASPSF